MKSLSHVCAWILLVALIALAPTLRVELPNTSEGRASDVYRQWAGVLRIWVCLGWQPGNGSIAPWLNEVAARFERAHPGVYVQVDPVSERQLAEFGSGAYNPPDALVFSPGLLAGAGGLVAIESALPLPPSLAGAGATDEGVFAAPIAMGGYAWAVNTQMLSGLPLWDADLPAPARKADPAFVMQAPADGAHLSWSGALLALCQAVPVGIQPEPTSKPAGDGLDLGLMSAESSDPLETPTPIPPATVFQRPSRLPDNFRTDNTVMGDFAAKRAAAVPVSQVEIKRLENLADTGRAPDYEIVAGLGTFTDQLALFGIVEGPKAQRGLCEALLLALLDERSQLALSGIRALRVTDGAPVYAANRGMSALEIAYAGKQVDVPGAFDSAYIERKRRALERALAGGAG